MIIYVIVTIALCIICFYMGCILCNNRNKKQCNFFEEEIENILKTKSNYLTDLKTMYIMQDLLMNSKNPATILQSRGIDDISIYGMGYVGKTFYRMLENTDIRIDKCIDQKKNLYWKKDIEIIRLDDVQKLSKVVVITPLGYYDEISTQLKKKREDVILIPVCDLLGVE